jgi:hypothetical protein
MFTFEESAPVPAGALSLGGGAVAFGELPVLGGICDGPSLNPANKLIEWIEAPAAPKIFRAAANAPHFGKCRWLEAQEFRRLGAGQ